MKETVLRFHDMQDWRASGTLFRVIDKWCLEHCEEKVQYTYTEHDIKDGFKFKSESDLMLFTLAWT